MGFHCAASERAFVGCVAGAGERVAKGLPLSPAAEPLYALFSRLQVFLCVALEHGGRSPSIAYLAGALRSTCDRLGGVIAPVVAAAAGERHVLEHGDLELKVSAEHI